MGPTIWTVINLFIYSSIKYPYYLKQEIDCKTKNFQKKCYNRLNYFDEKLNKFTARKNIL